MSQRSESIELRLATAADTGRILAIYTPYVLETSITFEVEVPDLAAFAQRMTASAKTYPTLVAEIGGTVVGYAYAHPCGEKAAYGWNAELTVYLDQKFRAKGCGRLLCEALLDLLSAQGIRNVFSLITVPNDASFRLHNALGFEHIGLQKRAGYKCGAWHDVAWLQKSIGDFSGHPSDIVAISELDKTTVEAVFVRAQSDAALRDLTFSACDAMDRDGQ